MKRRLGGRRVVRVVGGLVLLGAGLACQPRTNGLPGGPTVPTTAPTSTTTSTPVPPAPVAAFVGDSVLTASDSSVRAAFEAAGIPVETYPLSGKATIGAQPTLDALAARVPRPDVVILALGTRDLDGFARNCAGPPAGECAATGQAADPSISPWTIPEIEARLTRLRAQFAGTCLVVTTVNAHRTIALNDYPWRQPLDVARWNPAAAELDRHLVSLADRTIDWDAALLAHGPTWVDGAQTHPAGDGRTWLAQQAVAATQACRAR